MNLLKTISLTFLLLCFTGCDDSKKNKAEIDSIRTKQEEIESRLQKVEAASKQTSNWVLWVSTEWADKSKLNNFGWPKMLTSFNTREECFRNAQQWSLPNGKQISEDPVMLSDGVVVFTYSCMPPSVDLRVRVR
jgi:hypothetical protein